MFIFKNDILNALGKPVAAQENDTNNETTISHKKRKFAKICTTQKWLCYGRKQKINRHFLSVLLWVINAHKPSRFFVRFLLKVYSCIRFSLYWQVNNIVYICFQIQKKPQKIPPNTSNINLKYAFCYVIGNSNWIESKILLVPNTKHAVNIKSLFLFILVFKICCVDFSRISVVSRGNKRVMYNVSITWSTVWCTQ